MMVSKDESPLLEDMHLNVEDGDDEGTNTLQVVLLGKTGSGKSSLANTILGGLAEFNVSHSAGSETKVCKTKTQIVNGRELRLIDTPGLFDTETDNTKLSSENVKLVIECAPGVHAFLILLKVEKFTKHEKEVTERVLKEFTKEALKYAIVVFTHGDQLPDEETIESWVEDNENVKSMVEKFGGRCLVFDNKYWNNGSHSHRNNQVQIENLLKTIEEIVEKNGGCYTNKTLKTIEKSIKQLQKKDPQMSRERAKEMLYESAWPKVKNVVIGCAIGVLVGAAVIPVSFFLIPCAITGAVVSTVSVVTYGVVGGLAGQVSKQKKDKKE